MRLRDIMAEVGEGSSKPFKWSGERSPRRKVMAALPDKGSRDIEFKYKFDANGLPYIVHFSGTIERKTLLQLPGMSPPSDRAKYETGFNVSFNTVGGHKAKVTPDTNRGDQFRVLATVVDIIKAFVKDMNSGGPRSVVADELFIAPKGDDTEAGRFDSKRARFYQAYINKQLGSLTANGIKYKAAKGTYSGSEYIKLYAVTDSR